MRSKMRNYRLYLNEAWDRTVYNALKSYPNYVYKYGKGDALFNLKYNFHLNDDELLWIIDKCIQKGWMNKGDKEWNIDYLGLNPEVETFTLTEDIDNMKKFYPNIPDDKFQSIVELDPTYKAGSKNAGSYGRWLLALANKNNGNINNVGHIKDLLIRYDSNKKNLKDKDIMKFKSMQEVEDYLNNEDNYNQLTDRQKLRQTQTAVRKSDITKDADLLYEDGEWEVWTPKTYEASCKLGQGTSWCTASTSSDYYYNYYTDYSPLYININKRTGEKYQFHFETSSFMDAEDHAIDVEEFFNKNPNLKNFYIKILKPELDNLKTITFTVSNFANHASNEDISEAFIETFFDSLYGDFYHLDDYFDFDFGSINIQDLDMRSLNDSIREQLKQLGIDVSVDDSEIVKQIKSDVDIEWAFNNAILNGMQRGTIEDAVSDFKIAIQKVFPNGIECNGDVIRVMSDPKTSYSDLLNLYITHDSSYTIEDEYDEKFGRAFSKVFYEPRYGWSGFDEELFRETLEDSLAELIEERKRSNESLFLNHEKLLNESNIGYHYGDLGKADFKHNFGNRSTGGFGTGTYFIGKPVSEIGYKSSYEGRPEHKIDLSKYKLFVPRDYDRAQNLHRGLLWFNNNANQVYVTDFETILDEKSKAINATIDLAYSTNKQDRQRAYKILYKYLSKYENYYDKKELDGATAYDIQDIIRSIYDKLHAEYEEYEDALNSLLSGLSYSVSKDKLAKIIKEVVNDTSDIAPSTLIMQKLGYDGIDTTHIKEMDNFSYGSVVYNL